MDEQERQARWAAALGISVDEYVHDDSEDELPAVESEQVEEQLHPHEDRWAS
jgi:hypothetical protein